MLTHIHKASEKVWQDWQEVRWVVFIMRENPLKLACGGGVFLRKVRRQYAELDLIERKSTSNPPELAVTSNKALFCKVPNSYYSHSDAR